MIPPMKPIALLSILCASVAAAPSQKAVRDRVDREIPSLLKLYQYLHANPEISFQEAKTGQRLGTELKTIGFKVTQNVGGHGVVCVLKNGKGPTVLVRTDTDALPVKEATGLSFASTRTTTDDLGKTGPTMHACGHDVHMACWTGTARVLAHFKKDWSGTLVFIGQPA